MSTAEQTRRRTLSSKTKALLGLLAFLAVSFAIFSSTWVHPTSHTIGAKQDRAYFMWFLRWMQYAVFNGHNVLFSRHLNYPTGVNMMWNGSEILPGIVLSPLTAAFGAGITFNLLATLGPALSAWSAMLLFKQGVERWTAAWIGGLIFGFSPFFMIQSLGHLHTTFAFLQPLILLALYEIFVLQKMRPAVAGVILGALVAAQLLTGEEILVITAMIAGACFVCLLIGYRKEIFPRARHVLTAGGTALLVVLVTCGIPLWVQFFGGARIKGAIQPVNAYASDVLGFFIPTRFQWLAPRWAVSHSARFIGGGTEHMAYLGIPLIVFLVWVIVRERARPAVRVAAVVGVIMASLSLGTHLNVNGHSHKAPVPWRLFAKIPVLQDVLASRLILGVFLAAGFLLAVGVDRIVVARSRVARAIGGLLVVAIVLSFVPKLPYLSTPLQRSTFFDSAEAAVIPDGTRVLLLPAGYGPKAGNEPMIWNEQARDRLVVFGGYFFAPTPPGPADTLVKTMFRIQSRIQRQGSAVPADAAQRATILDLIRKTGARFIVIGPISYQAQLSAYMTSVLGRQPQHLKDAVVWRL